MNGELFVAGVIVGSYLTLTCSIGLAWAYFKRKRDDLRGHGSVLSPKYNTKRWWAKRIFLWMLALLVVVAVWAVVARGVATVTT